MWTRVHMATPQAIRIRRRGTISGQRSRRSAARTTSPSRAAPPERRGERPPQPPCGGGSGSVVLAAPRLARRPRRAPLPQNAEANGPRSHLVAEGVGFEPTEPFGSPVFKTGAFNRSAIPPGRMRLAYGGGPSQGGPSRRRPGDETRGEAGTPAPPRMISVPPGRRRKPGPGRAGPATDPYAAASLSCCDTTRLSGRASTQIAAPAAAPRTVSIRKKWVRGIRVQ